MKKSKQIRLAGILMIMSWLLLFTFVLQWLSARYKAEKEWLQEELDRRFEETKLQVVDSTLIIHLIDPMIRDSQQMKVVLSLDDSAVRYRKGIQTFDTVIHENNGARKKNLVYKIDISDSASKKIFVMNRNKRFHADSGNIVLHSIRLMIGQTNDSAGHNPVFRKYLPANIDTSLFRKIFMEKMNKEGLYFPVTWPDGPDLDSTHRTGSLIYLNSRIFEGTVTASVDGFSRYLIKRIIPQILFALILLMLTGGAFIFIFRSLRKQVQLNDLRNDFISNISHELKTPVATVKVALESLRSFDMKKDPAVTSEYLNMASLEMDRLERLIGKVLNISALEEEDRIVMLRNSDLKVITEKVIRSMSSRFEQERAELVFEAPDENYRCPLDDLFVEGLLINLVDNSLKYAGEKPWIEIRLSQDQQMVQLEVSDRGPGIPEQYIRKVFDKFFRVPTGDRHNIKGHGLGLSYAARVMKQHKGSITVRNLEGRGCAFSMSFPKERASD